MKRLLFAAAIAAAAAPAVAADVGVSVTIGQPGFYGHIDIGDFPSPQLVYPEPVVIHRAPGVVYEPVYLHVPPGHEKHWSKYCGRYNACGRPVYFVQDNWYQRVYVPEYHKRHGPPDRHGDDRGRGHDRGDDDHGPGRGHGRGHGHD